MHSGVSGSNRCRAYWTFVAHRAVESSSSNARRPTRGASGPHRCEPHGSCWSRRGCGRRLVWPWCALAPPRNACWRRCTAKCSKRLKTGAPGWDRTSDPWLRRPILYPLSYGRVTAEYTPAGRTRAADVRSERLMALPVASERAVKAREQTPSSDDRVGSPRRRIHDVLSTRPGDLTIIQALQRPSRMTE